MKLKLLKYNNEIFIKWISKLFYKMRNLSSNWFFFFGQKIQMNMQIIWSFCAVLEDHIVTYQIN